MMEPPRYPYRTHASAWGPPSAPALDVQIANPISGGTVQFLAQLDTGADSTFIPLAVIDALRLRPVSDVQVFFADGSGRVSPQYVVNLVLLDRRFERQLVTAMDDVVVVVGRDLLNEFALVHHGPRLEFWEYQ